MSGTCDCWGLRTCTIDQFLKRRLTVLCNSCFFCCIPVRQHYEASLVEYEDFDKLLRAISNSSNPIDPIQLDPDVIKRLEAKGYKPRDAGSTDATYSSTYVNFSFMGTAGGCGGYGSGGKFIRSLTIPFLYTLHLNDHLDELCCFQGGGWGGQFSFIEIFLGFEVNFSQYSSQLFVML
jgi:hypothetical protein